MVDRFIGVDYGGTNLRVYEVDPRRGILPEIEGKKSNDIKSGNLTTNKDLTGRILGRIEDIVSKKDNVYIGCSAAGDVDEERLVIKASPNVPINGEITFARDLRDKGYEFITITNDMRAAGAGTTRFGAGKGFDNVLVATYSTGYNCAKVINGEVVTQAEFGHQHYVPKNRNLEDLKCGCGGKGHLESYVSGGGAVAMLKRLVNNAGLSKTFVEDNNARDIYEWFRQDPRAEPQKSVRDEQVNAIAESFGRMIGAYNPLDIIVCMGSQTKDWDLLFDPAISLYLGNKRDCHLPSIESPQIVKKRLRKLGVVGGVAYFLNMNPELDPAA